MSRTTLPNRCRSTHRGMRCLLGEGHTGPHTGLGMPTQRNVQWRNEATKRKVRVQQCA